MTTVNLIQDFVSNYNENDYTYSISLSSGVVTEDELKNTSTFTISTNTIDLTYRDEDWYDYISTNYVAYGWYDIQPVNNDIWDALFTGSGFTQSDIYFYQEPTSMTFIQYNQSSEGILVYDGSSWINDTSLYTLYTFKMMQSTITI